MTKGQSLCHIRLEVAAGDACGAGSDVARRADTDDFKNQFKDKNVEAFSYTKSGASADDEIDALSGATLTTNAVTNGVNAGICCFNYCSESGLLSGEGGNS